MDDLDYCHLLAQLTRHEGFRLRHYQDTAGTLTVAAKQRPIGAVRAEAETTTLECDLRRIARQMEDQWPTFHKLDSVRQRVLVHIAFNIGLARLLAQRRLLRAVEGCHWNWAADEMFMSQWGTQDQGRAVVLAEMMRTGRDQFAIATKFRRGEDDARIIGYTASAADVLCESHSGSRRGAMDAVDYRTLLDQLIRIEAVKLAPYRDAAGNLIVAPDDYVERMGVRATGMAVLEVDLRAVARELEEQWLTVSTLDAVRQRVLVHMAFNMGVRGLLTMMRFVSAVEFRLWETAADDLLISQWAKQEPRCASVLAAMMRTGRDEVLKVIQP